MSTCQMWLQVMEGFLIQFFGNVHLLHVWNVIKSSIFYILCIPEVKRWKLNPCNHLWSRQSFWNDKFFRHSSLLYNYDNNFKLKLYIWEHILAIILFSPVSSRMIYVSRCGHVYIPSSQFSIFSTYNKFHPTNLFIQKFAASENIILRLSMYNKIAINYQFFAAITACDKIHYVTS